MCWKKENRKLTVLSLLLIALGIGVCLLPYTFWVTGALFAAVGVFTLALRFLPNATVRNVLLLLFGIGMALLTTLMGLIAVSGTRDPDALNCDAAIVLGAQVEGETPSLTLRTRLNTALEFLQENDDAVLFLSGGQGPDEAISEAEAMYRYLTARGAEPERLILEDASGTTLENLRNSQALAEAKGIDFDRICIITSEFHTARGRFLASRLDIESCGYPARTPWLFRINYYLREIPAFLKAWVQTR